MRPVRLEQGPEGSPNSSFGLYDTETGQEYEFTTSDWEWAGLASHLGWIPCECEQTDGTVPCAHRTVSEMLSEAFDWLSERDGTVFLLSDYDEVPDSELEG